MGSFDYILIEKQILVVFNSFFTREFKDLAEKKIQTLGRLVVQNKTSVNRFEKILVYFSVIFMVLFLSNLFSSLHATAQEQSKKLTVSFEKQC